MGYGAGAWCLGMVPSPPSVPAFPSGTFVVPRGGCTVSCQERCGQMGGRAHHPSPLRCHVPGWVRTLLPPEHGAVAHHQASASS